MVCDDKWLQAAASSIYMAGLMIGVIISGSASDRQVIRAMACKMIYLNFEAANKDLLLQLTGYSLSFQNSLYMICVPLQILCHEYKNGTQYEIK